MRTEATTTALLLVVSAMFEALPPRARQRAAILIDDSMELIDDLDAQMVLASFRDGPVERVHGSDILSALSFPTR